MHVVYAKVLSRRSGRKGFDILLYLPETYEVSDSDIWGVGVVDMNGCMEASREILRLCKERSVDEKRCIFLSLFEEEVVKNIIEHGFRRKKKNHIMIRLVFLKDRITLNILDDCPYFDPQSYYDQLQESNERIKGFGIRIVMRMAKKASYTNSFRLNHLMIEI